MSPLSPRLEQVELETLDQPGIGSGVSTFLFEDRIFIEP